MPELGKGAVPKQVSVSSKSPLTCYPYRRGDRTVCRTKLRHPDRSINLIPGHSVNGNGVIIKGCSHLCRHVLRITGKGHVPNVNEICIPRLAVHYSGITAFLKFKNFSFRYFDRWNDTGNSFSVTADS